ncbi:putative response regulatory protein [mine drainage metagenome]|uniref:Putative response regulatory protein n=1 Tax=mine drainage metagenome TaxID=410659 RepID=A0A1J5RBZ5_9ZZZZ
MSSAGLEQQSVETSVADGPRILLYSDNVDTRQQVLLAVGWRLGKNEPPIRWVEVATEAAVISAMDGGLFDLLVLDGETGKVGGMGLCRQLKDEIFQCPPVVVLTGRPQDAWLASWSYADGVVSRPLDPIEVQRAVAELLVAPADAA